MSLFILYSICATYLTLSQMEQLAVFASLRSVQGAGLACQLGRRFKAFHALRSPPATRAPLRGLCRLLRLSPFRGPYNRTPTP